MPVGVAAVQKSDGSFSACIDGCEDDMRFVFCAAAICFMLDYWGDVDKERMYQFIMKSMVWPFEDEWKLIDIYISEMCHLLFAFLYSVMIMDLVNIRMLNVTAVLRSVP